MKTEIYIPAGTSRCMSTFFKDGDEGVGEKRFECQCDVNEMR